MIDGLHTLNLGVLQRYVVRVFWSLINANSWYVGGPQDVLRAQSVSLLRSMLMDWYATQKHRGFTEVQDLSLAMLGDGDSQKKLKTKAFVLMRKNLLQIIDLSVVFILTECPGVV